MMPSLPTYCGASKMFTVNIVADSKAVIRTLVYFLCQELWYETHYIGPSAILYNPVHTSSVRSHHFATGTYLDLVRVSTPTVL